MRIRRIEIRAFGPFTDRTIRFDSGPPGLHIIFGPNETGKSSALRALKALLYGFPERIADNFLHPNDQLLVGGILENDDGRRISFLRRKRRKTDTFDMEERPIDRGALEPFLHGIDQDMFETLYAIDHPALVRGGRDILAQKGEVGQALFSAGAGISSLRDVLDSLDGEADGLFKARGSKQEINRAIARYRGLQKEIRAAALPGGQWKDLVEALERTEDELRLAEEKRREKDRERRLLERIRQTMPHLAQRRDLMARLALLGDAAALPDDFALRRKAVEKVLHGALQKRAIATDRLEALRKKRESISLRQSILDNGELIEDLYQGLGSYRKAMKDRPGLEGRRVACLAEAESLLKEIPTRLTLAGVEELRSVLVRRKVIQRLAANHEALEQKVDQARGRLGEVHRALERTEEGLARLPSQTDFTSLEGAVKLARKSGDMDSLIARKEREIHELKRSCLDELGRAGMWSGEPGLILNLKVPLRETVIRFDKEFREYEEKRRETEKERKKALDDLSRVDIEIGELKYSGEVPTEEELAGARKERDRGWLLIRRRWLHREDANPGAGSDHGDPSLADDYERRVAEADSLADRLRREADRVHKFAALRSERDALSDRIQRAGKTLDSLDREFGRTSLAWKEAWKECGIEPLEPAEMAGWLNGFEKARLRAEEIERAEGDLALMLKEREDLMGRLLRELNDPEKVRQFKGEPRLGPVLVFCEEALENLREVEERRTKLNERREELGLDLEHVRNQEREAAEGLRRWKKQWDESSLLPGGTRAMEPEEANDMVDALQRCFGKLEEAAQLENRIRGIDRDAGGFTGAVETLRKDAAPGIKAGSPEEVVMRLKALLGQALESRTLLDKYEREIRETEEEIREASGAMEAAEERMAGLRRMAGCGEDGDLDAAEAASTEYRDLKSRISGIETLLIEGAGGYRIEDLEKQAEGVNPDELPGRIQSLAREVEEELDPEIKRLSELLGEKRKELQQMDGSARAADMAGEAEQVVAAIRRLSERFIRLKVASKILRQEIERFRAENQDPVLGIASGYFHRLTLGSFQSLRTDEDGRGNPVLVGLRPDNSMVRVEGMSSGTRDQLYLALRLASLERRLETDRPMPFIVDDILINFDDDRSRAALGLLADIGSRTQVILFTHHDRIRQEAEEMTGKWPVRVHLL